MPTFRSVPVYQNRWIVARHALLIGCFMWTFTRGLSRWYILVTIFCVCQMVEFIISYFAKWIYSINNYSCHYMLAPQDINWDTCIECSGRAVQVEKQRGGLDDSFNYLFFILWATVTVLQSCLKFSGVLLRKFLHSALRTASYQNWYVLSRFNSSPQFSSPSLASLSLCSNFFHVISPLLIGS